MNESTICHIGRKRDDGASVRRIVAQFKVREIGPQMLCFHHMVNLKKMDKPISKEAWKTASLPTNRIPLGFEACYTSIEISLMKKGHKPEDMDDKWFIYFEENWLYFCRSWSGYYIFGIQIEETDGKTCVKESWVNREPKQFNSTDLEFDRKTLQFLIARILLNIPMPQQNQ